MLTLHLSRRGRPENQPQASPRIKQTYSAQSKPLVKAWTTFQPLKSWRLECRWLRSFLVPIAVQRLRLHLCGSQPWGLWRDDQFQEHTFLGKTHFRVSRDEQIHRRELMERSNEMSTRADCFSALFALIRNGYN